LIIRATWAGGNPYIPFDPTSTISTGEPVLNWQMLTRHDILTIKEFLTIGIKRNRPGYNLEFMLDLRTEPIIRNVYLQRIDPKTGEIKNFFQMGFFPMATWRIQF